MASPGFDAPVKVGGTVLKMVFEAAFRGDLPLLKSLVTMLDNGKGRPKEAIESLRWEDDEEVEGFGVLHAAASRGCLEVCRYLVEELRVDVDGVDKEGRTPLLYLAMCFKDVTHLAIAKYLLDHGANRDKASYDGFSPLHCAAGSGDCDMVQLLLAKGAYVDPIAPVGTPLHFAATKGHDGTMQILLDHNADYNKMVNGKTPVIAAIDGGSRECYTLLIKKVLMHNLVARKHDDGENPPNNLVENSCYRSDMKAGADAKVASTYAVEKLVSSKLVSKDFVDCMLKDNAANSAVHDDDELVSKRKIRAAGFKKLGSHAFKLKDYFTAQRCYNAAIKFSPDDATLFSNRSLCWLLVGDKGSALADANQCRKMRPDWPKACYRQGAVLMSLKDYEGASERFLDGLKLDPWNSEMENALREAMEFLKTSWSTKAK